MSKRAGGNAQSEITMEAARIICEEAVFDYRLAKTKAAQRLRLNGRTPMPENARIQQAVIEYQRLFGGREYAEDLVQLRRVAVQVMKLLAPFDPRLVGAIVSGATVRMQRIQLHAFPEQPEAIDVFLQERGIAIDPAERNYRYPDGRELSIPLVRFEAGEVGVDVAAFDSEDLRSAPLSPADGLPMRRLNLAQAEALAQIGVETILAGSAG